MFGALFAKTWRIYFLWTADPLNKNLRVTDVQVFLVVLVALAPQLILLVLWTAIATPTVVFEPQDPWRASLDIPDCSVSTAHYVMIALMCGINFGKYNTYLNVTLHQYFVADLTTSKSAQLFLCCIFIVY